MRPRRFGIDVVNGYRRNTTPIVQSGINEQGKIAFAQVRRRLDIHRRTKNNARNRNGPRKIVHIRFFGVRHFCIGFSTEVLHDYFLQMAVPLMPTAKR